MAHAKKLAKEVAKTLRQPEQPLLQAIGKETIPLYLVEAADPTNEEFLCRSLSTDTEVAHVCRKPVLYGTAACPEHSRGQETVSAKLPRLHRFVTDEDEVYYYDELLRNVYDKHYCLCGVLSRSTPPVFHKIVVSEE